MQTKPYKLESEEGLGFLKIQYGRLAHETHFLEFLTHCFSINLMLNCLTFSKNVSAESESTTCT